MKKRIVFIFLAAVLTGCTNPWMEKLLDPLFKNDSSGPFWDPSPPPLTLEEKNAEDFGAGAFIDDAFNVYNTGDWTYACTTINGGGSNKNYIINVYGSVAVSGTTGNTFGSVSNITVSLRGGGLSLSSDGILLYVGTNQELVIRDCTLTGIGNNRSLVQINGTVCLKSGGTISGNFSSGASNGGGGVYVAHYGTFIMNGGTISGNSANGGGGVAVGGTFTMSGGTISGNFSSGAVNGGGVYVGSGGAFTKTAGTIYGYDSGTPSDPRWNKADNGNPTSGHAVYYDPITSQYYRDITLNAGDSISTATLPASATGLYDGTNWIKKP